MLVRECSFESRGNVASVSEALREKLSITTFATGSRPLLTGSVDSSSVELYRSRPPLRGIREPTYFRGQFESRGEEVVLKGEIVSSDSRRVYFNMFPMAAVFMAVVAVMAGATAGRPGAFGVTIGFASILLLGAYLLVRIRRSSVNAEVDLLVSDIQQALNERPDN